MFSKNEHKTVRILIGLVATDTNSRTTDYIRGGDDDYSYWCISNSLYRNIFLYLYILYLSIDKLNFTLIVLVFKGWVWPLILNSTKGSLVPPKSAALIPLASITVICWGKRNNKNKRERRYEMPMSAFFSGYNRSERWSESANNFLEEAEDQREISAWSYEICPRNTYLSQ